MQRLTPLVEGFSSQDWATTRQYFESLTMGLPDQELAQTGYNTIFRKLVGRTHLSHEQAFVRQVVIEQAPLEPFETFQFDQTQDLSSLVEMVLLSFPFDIPFARLNDDVKAITALMTENLQTITAVKTMSAVMLRSVFYRNKGAHLIGRLSLGKQVCPGLLL